MGSLDQMIDQVAKEKGISRDTLVEALEAALVSAGFAEEIWLKVELEAQYSDSTGEIGLGFRDVVAEVQTTVSKLTLRRHARNLIPMPKLGTS